MRAEKNALQNFCLMTVVITKALMVDAVMVITMGAAMVVVIVVVMIMSIKTTVIHSQESNDFSYDGRSK